MATTSSAAAVRQSAKDGQQILREARSLLCRYDRRLSDKAFGEVTAAVDQLDKTLASPVGDANANVAAAQALDIKLDEHLGFGRKSTTRQYIESISGAIFFALLLRAFVLEPFKIPSGSMIPTLQVGDHIFVNKFIYGIRVPWTDIKLGTSFRRPQRGEVIVFKYPRDPDKDFIKRIVAIEGDTIEGRDNQLFINGQPVPHVHLDGDCEYDDIVDENSDQWEMRSCDGWKETVHGVDYVTYFDRNAGTKSFPPRTVPPNAVFCMGDNRDNSHDSRAWGFVPDELIKGKAELIWLSLGNPGDQNDSWFAQRIHSLRFNRMFSFIR